MNKQEQATMQAELEALRAENAALKNPPKKERTLTCKVSVKGGVSIYGLGKFPVSLYKGQWHKLIAFIQSGELDKFMVANDQFLTVKGQGGEAAIVTPEQGATITAIGEGKDVA